MEAFKSKSLDTLWFMYPQLYETPLHAQQERCFPFIRLVMNTVANALETDRQTQHTTAHPTPREGEAGAIVPLIFSCTAQGDNDTSIFSDEDVGRFMTKIKNQLGPEHTLQLLKRVELRADHKLYIDLSLEYLQNLANNHANLLPSKIF